MWDGWVGTKNIKEGSLFFFAQVSESRNVARTAILVIEAVVLDATLVRFFFLYIIEIANLLGKVYRVYIIWGQRLLPALIPALTTIGTFGKHIRTTQHMQ
jgi:hypothetical protein